MHNIYGLIHTGENPRFNNSNLYRSLSYIHGLGLIVRVKCS